MISLSRGYGGTVVRWYGIRGYGGTVVRWYGIRGYGGTMVRWYENTLSARARAPTQSTSPKPRPPRVGADPRVCPLNAWFSLIPCAVGLRRRTDTGVCPLNAWLSLIPWAVELRRRADTGVCPYMWRFRLLAHDIQKEQLIANREQRTANR